MPRRHKGATGSLKTMATTPPDFELVPLGDRAWLARFGSGDRAAAWASSVREAGGGWVVDVVASYESVAVFADPDLIDPEKLPTLLRNIPVPDREGRAGRVFRVPVCYEGEDLHEVASRVGLTESEVISLHVSTEYVVQAIGFLPGFPYLGNLPDTLLGLPRRERPRTRVPAGSVAIAGRQSCIYPRESPGGWHLIGRTPQVIADLDSGFLPISVGDRVRFEPIDASTFAELIGLRCGAEAGVEGCG